MKTTLTPEQIASYRENGFVVQEDFLSPDELATWRRVIDAAVAGRGRAKLAKGNANLTEPPPDDSYYSRVFCQRVNLWVDNPEVGPLILDPEIGKMCCDLEGIDAIRCWHDQALIKEPWGNPTAWHVDNPYWSFHSPHAISIWIALDDATLQNGSLFFMPRSHREGDYERYVGIGQHYGALFDKYPEWKNRAPVAAPMKAGSCSFHNGMTAHGAGANSTPGYRRAMTCAFMPDGARFNGKQNILSAEQMATLKIGDLLMDDVQNPVVYRRPA